MRILHIISGDLWGGAESLVYNLILESSRHQGIEVYALLFNDGILSNRLKSAKINTKVLNENDLNQLLLLYKSYKYIESIKPQIIHTHKHKENVIGSLISFILSIPSIRTAHGDSESNIRVTDGLKYLYKLINIYAGIFLQEKIVSVSRDLYNKLLKQYPSDKLVIIANGIILHDKLSNSPPSRTSNHNFNVAIICRLTSVKRVDIFLAIARIIKEKHLTSINFIVFGEGPLLHDLKVLASKYAISDNVKFMGFIKDMNRYYPMINILVITSDHEGLPMNLLESIKYKIPVVSHNVGDIKDVLCDGNCGIIIDDQDPNKYAEAIISLFNNQEIISKYTHDAYENVSINYSLKSTTNQYLRLYQSILD